MDGSDLKLRFLEKKRLLKEKRSSLGGGGGGEGSAPPSVEKAPSAARDATPSAAGKVGKSGSATSKDQKQDAKKRAREEAAEGGENAARATKPQHHASPKHTPDVSLTLKEKKRSKVPVQQPQQQKEQQQSPPQTQKPRQHLQQEDQQEKVLRFYEAEKKRRSGEVVKVNGGDAHGKKSQDAQGGGEDGAVSELAGTPDGKLPEGKLTLKQKRKLKLKLLKEEAGEGGGKPEGAATDRGGGKPAQEGDKKSAGKAVKAAETQSVGKAAKAGGKQAAGKEGKAGVGEGAARASSAKREREEEGGRGAVGEGKGGKKPRVESAPAAKDSGGSGRGGGKDGLKGKSPGGKEKGQGGKGGAAGGAAGVEEVGVEEGAGDGKYPFEVDVTDHAETPAEAYTHIAPVLSAIAEGLGKSKAELLIYDPYFCQGSVKKRLAAHGFTNVYNKKEDFYKMIEDGKTPSFDVLLTNPPYSDDHPERLLTFVCDSKKPWLLLVPNFIYTKDYYKATALDEKHLSTTGFREPTFLVPQKRYRYWTPEFLLETKSGGSTTPFLSTSPFPTFWFMQPCKFAGRVTSALSALPSKARNQVTFADTVEKLPNEVRAAFDPFKKRKSSKARARIAKNKSSGKA